MKWPLGVLTLWSFIVVNGAWKFPEASKNWLLVCLISLPGLYISITRWAPPASMWLKRQTEIDLTCTSKECVCTVPTDKAAVQPKQISEVVWKASKLNIGSYIIDFLHGSINKISYVVTHLFNLFPLFGQPTTTQFRCPNPIPREEIETEWFQTWSISQVNIPLETHKVVNRNFFAKDVSSQKIDWLTSL